MRPHSHRIGRLAAALAVAGLGLGVAPAFGDPAKFAVLRTINKVTARVATTTVAVGDGFAMGTLSVAVRACDKRPPEEPPESAAFLEIVEHQPDEPPVVRFTGWMFASSPALSALEHPIYDVWVIDCMNEATTEGGTSP